MNHLITKTTFTATAPMPTTFKVGDILQAPGSKYICVIVCCKELPESVVCGVKKFRRHRFIWMNRLHAWWLVETYKAKKSC
jgi:hypothetical protein